MTDVAMPPVLSRSERAILAKLYAACPRVVANAALQSGDTVRKHVFSLRKRMPEGAWIETIHTQGYRLVLGTDAARFAIAEMCRPPIGEHV